MYQIETGENKQIVLAIIALPKQAVEAVDEAQRNIPLETILQFEELAERRIIRQIRKVFAR